MVSHENNTGGCYLQSKACRIEALFSKVRYGMLGLKEKPHSTQSYQSQSNLGECLCAISPIYSFQMGQILDPTHSLSV